MLDASEDAYDQSFVLLALAHAHKAGHRKALASGTETFAFIDEYLADARLTGFWTGRRQRVAPVKPTHAPARSISGLVCHNGQPRLPAARRSYLDLFAITCSMRNLDAWRIFQQ